MRLVRCGIVRSITFALVLLLLPATGVAILPAFADENLPQATAVGTLVKIEKSVSRSPTGLFFDSLHVKPGTKVYFRIRITSYSVEPLDVECRDEMCDFREPVRLTNRQRVEVLLPMVFENNGLEDQHTFNVASVAYRDPASGRIHEAYDVCHVVCGPSDPNDGYAQLLTGGSYIDGSVAGRRTYNNFAGDMAGFLGSKGFGKFAHYRKREDSSPAQLFVIDTDAGDTYNVNSAKSGLKETRYYEIQGFARCFVEGKPNPEKVFFTLKATDNGEDGPESYLLTVTGPPGTNTSFSTFNQWKNEKDPQNPVVIRTE